MDVRVKESEAPGWDALTDSPTEYVLIGGESDKTHHSNHYLTGVATGRLLKIVDAYNKVFPAGPLLQLNDANLVWGGKFDIHGKWGGDSAHFTHQRGREIDIRANQLSTAIPFMRFNRFIKLAASTGAAARVHCDFPKSLKWACSVNTGPTRHFHVNLGK